MQVGKADQDLYQFRIVDSEEPLSEKEALLQGLDRLSHLKQRLVGCTQPPIKVRLGLQVLIVVRHWHNQPEAALQFRNSIFKIASCAIEEADPEKNQARCGRILSVYLFNLVEQTFIFGNAP